VQSIRDLKTFRRVDHSATWLICRRIVR